MTRYRRLLRFLRHYHHESDPVRKVRLALIVLRLQ